jgi:hypothetical protein
MAGGNGASPVAVNGGLKSKFSRLYGPLRLGLRQPRDLGGQNPALATELDSQNKRTVVLNSFGNVEQLRHDLDSRCLRWRSLSSLRPKSWDLLIGARAVALMGIRTHL